MRTIAIPTLLMTACLDYGLHQEVEVEPEEILEEICNGEDDNGDGSIDEGFGDLDADGTADCVDFACEVEEVPSGSVPLDADCGFDIDSPWNVTEEWAWRSRGSMTTPLIANLTDTDFDGDIDLYDTPNIVVVTLGDFSSFSDRLTVLTGDNGEDIWSMEGIYALGVPAIADATGDGNPEIVAFADDGSPILLGADGTVMWQAEGTVRDFLPGSSVPQAVVADLDGDGRAEIVADDLVLDGPTGAVLARLAVSPLIPYTNPTVGDLDLDGTQEIVYGGIVFDPQGNMEWSSTLLGTETDIGHWSAILDVDGDPEGEVVFIAERQVQIYEADGSLKTSWSAGTDKVAPPCAADFDGDGATEVAFASRHELYLFELDGTEIWRQTVSDNSGMAGCSGYDVDGDGAYEILYADEGTMRIMDGPTGETRWVTEDHSSATAFEYPTVADVDRDGSAEIVYVSWGYADHMGLHVLGHDGDGWAKSGSTWPNTDFAVTNVEADASLPADIPLYWQEHNTFRARPVIDQPGANLAIAFDDLCAAACEPERPVEVAVIVENIGDSEAALDTQVALYALDGDDEIFLDVQPLGAALPSGRHSATLVFSLTTDELSADGLLARVDDDGIGIGSVGECDEDDNEDVLLDLPCQ